MTWVTWGVVIGLVLAGWVAYEVRDELRWRRAERAGEEARQKAIARERRRPDRIVIHAHDWGPSHTVERWRWIIWNAAPDVDDVRGMLVPYALGSAPTRDQALADARQQAQDRDLPLEGHEVVDLHHLKDDE